MSMTKTAQHNKNVMLRKRERMGLPPIDKFEVGTRVTVTASTPERGAQGTVTEIYPEGSYVVEVELKPAGHGDKSWSIYTGTELRV